MTYSKAHQNFSNRLNKPEALTNPENFLGPNTQRVIEFWHKLDSLTEKQWSEVADRYLCKNPYDRGSSATGAAAREATYEIIAMHLLLEQGKKLIFVPLFDGL